MGIESRAPGVCNKQWLNVNGRLFLAKGNTYEYGSKHWEPYSEAIASIIANILGIEHVKYWLDDGNKFKQVTRYGIEHISVCEHISLADGEQLDTLNTLLEMSEYKDDIRSFLYDNGLIDKKLTDMLLFDAIIGNVDRHNRNISYITKNGKILRMAPIYDNGASLLALSSYKDCLNYKSGIGVDTSKPLRSSHSRQIELLRRTIHIEKMSADSKERLKREIFVNIQPILILMPKYRAEAIKRYLSNRIDYFL